MNIDDDDENTKKRSHKETISDLNFLILVNTNKTRQDSKDDPYMSYKPNYDQLTFSPDNIGYVQFLRIYSILGNASKSLNVLRPIYQEPNFRF